MTSRPWTSLTELGVTIGVALMLLQTGCGSPGESNGSTTTAPPPATDVPGPSDADGSVDADEVPGADTEPTTDTQMPGGDAATMDTAADTAADTGPEPPASPWLQTWGDCDGSVQRTPGSFNSLAGRDLVVTLGAEGLLVMTIDGWFDAAGSAGLCQQSWADGGATAELVPPLDCREFWTGGTATFLAGTATLDGATIAIEMTGTQPQGAGQPVSDVVLTLTCTACPPEPCGGRCEEGACCGAGGEACCGSQWCAGDLECFDGLCGTCGDDGGPCCPGPSWDECGDGLECSAGLCGPITCDANYCQDNGYADGYYCDGDTQRDCFTNSDGCFIDNLVGRQECGPGGCDVTTGTCGGCDLSDPCASIPDGANLCGGGAGVSEQVCGLVGGCPGVVATNACPSFCIFGAGCCRSEGLPCCNGVTPSCDAGLSCVDGTCMTP